MLRTPVVLMGPDRPLSIASAARVAQAEAIAAPTPAAEEAMAAARSRLDQIVAEARQVYGVTTGFGPLANRLVPPSDAALLQQNLVHHLASGVGPSFAWEEARAVTLARFASLVQGWSGVSSDAMASLAAVLASSLAPKLPAIGTVGASGDLTPLAHLVLCLQGRGSFLNRDGTEIDGEAALTRLGLPPLDLGTRDGLALVNGTAAMTGLATLSAAEITRLIGWSIALTAALAELLAGRAEAWAPEFGTARPHPGQVWALEALRNRLEDADRVLRVPLANETSAVATRAAVPRAGQDAYTLRCAPQVIGAVADLAAWHARVVETELNAVTDNPLLPAHGTALALHGGNFMGQHVGLASDALANGVTVLAGLAERQIARLTDERLNGGFPPFLQRGTPGLNSGLMGAQVTATALVAEMRCTGAASTQSLSTNGANQDVVSMGTIAARHVRQALTHLARVQAVLALAVAQGGDLVTLGLAPGSGSLSPAAAKLVAWVRDRSPALETDRPLGAEIEALAQDMRRADAPA